MSTPVLSQTFSRLIVAGACLLSTVSCGGELLRTGRGAGYLVVTSVLAGAEGGDESSFLHSDVRTAGGIVNDNVRIALRLEAKNPSTPLAAINAVTMTRYTVQFKRTDGQNRPGVDVPFGFSGGLSNTIGDTGGEVVFVLVRHQAKLEPPLSNMASAGGQLLISTVAEITLYGRDQNGNEVTTTALIDVHFGDFADEE